MGSRGMGGWKERVGLGYPRGFLRWWEPGEIIFEKEFSTAQNIFDKSNKEIPKPLRKGMGLESKSTPCTPVK